MQEKIITLFMPTNETYCTRLTHGDVCGLIREALKEHEEIWLTRRIDDKCEKVLPAMF